MEATDVFTVSLLTEATDAPTEDMVATDVATSARGKLRLLLRLKLMLTTATVMDVAMEVTGVLTDSLLTVATDALTEDMEATDVATMARGGLRLLLRPRLLTDTAMAAAMEAMEATAAPTEDMVATGLMAAMAAPTGMATESRQQPEHQHYMNNLELLDMNL